MVTGALSFLTSGYFGVLTLFQKVQDAPVQFLKRLYVPTTLMLLSYRCLLPHLAMPLHDMHIKTLDLWSPQDYTEQTARARQVKAYQFPTALK